MTEADIKTPTLEFKYKNIFVDLFSGFYRKHFERIVLVATSIISLLSYIYYYLNGLGLAYNDARSHLDISRRVVEGLKTGAAQLGSVWLPLPHVLMLPTVWNDFFWHSGLSGALVSMLSFIIVNYVIIRYLKEIGVSLGGRSVAVLIFILNINILYLQSTAMTELLLLATMMLGSYEVLLWCKNENILNLIKAAFYIMLSTLVRYDGWFLLAFATIIVFVKSATSKNRFKVEGMLVFFLTLAGFGVFLWLLWNLIIFGDPLYFAFGPYSAHSQQTQLEQAGNLATKKDLILSIRMYMYALIFNSQAYIVFLSFIGMLMIWTSKHLKKWTKIATAALIAPLIFNIVALYLGHSVLFVQGVSGNTWFNVRYGIMLAPSIAIFVGYLIDKSRFTRPIILGTLALTLFFFIKGGDAVTIDDARVGSSQKNVSEVSDYLKIHATNTSGFILISAASHDAIIFSSGLPMKRFIHEGTGAYWKAATTLPDRWARWIVMRTNDDSDQTFRLIKSTPGFKRYKLVREYPFADVYELKEAYLPFVQTQPVLKQEK